MKNQNCGTLGDIPLKPEPIIISDLVVRMEVHGWLLAKEVQHRTTKHGKPYRQLILRDQNGNEITTRQFDLPQGDINIPQAGKVVLIEGMTEEFQNTLHIKLYRAELDE